MSTQRPEVKTLANLEAAFAGESMAHIKYRYFARLARESGDEETAKTFEATAEAEGQAAAVAEMNEQIEESEVHAAQFRATLEKAQKRFAALAKVEERHTNHYKAQLAKVSAQTA